MPWNKTRIRIVLTGPESTGKTTLAGELAAYFGGVCIPEYARKYAETLGRAYKKKDLAHIAETQVKQYREAVSQGRGPLVFDTFLVITKIWFQEAFGSAPSWIDDAIRECPVHLYLLCFPDIPWTYDPVRENPGYRRKELFLLYRQELGRAGLPYHVVKGKGKTRFMNCVKRVRGLLS